MLVSHDVGHKVLLSYDVGPHGVGGHMVLVSHDVGLQSVNTHVVWIFTQASKVIWLGRGRGWVVFGMPNTFFICTICQ